MSLAELLDYPDDDVLARREAIARTAPPELAGFLAWWTTADPDEVRARYVDDFDLAARSSLYLTFHRFGDRRERGRALIGLKRLYRELGWELDHWELPDYLPLVLELADVEPAAGRELLDEFAPEVDEIRTALAERGSPWADVLELVA